MVIWTLHEQRLFPSGVLKGEADCWGSGVKTEIVHQVHHAIAAEV